MNGSSDGALSGTFAQERAVPFRHAGESGVIHLLDGILPRGELIGENQVLVKGRDGGEDPIRRRRRETGGRGSFRLRGGEYKHKALCPLGARRAAREPQK